MPAGSQNTHSADVRRSLPAEYSELRSIDLISRYDDSRLGEKTLIMEPFPQERQRVAHTLCEWYSTKATPLTVGDTIQLRMQSSQSWVY